MEAKGKFEELENITQEELTSIQDALRPSDVLVITPTGVTLLSEGLPDPIAAGLGGAASWLAFRWWLRRKASTVDDLIKKLEID